MSSTTAPTISDMAGDQLRNFTFGTVDYVVFVVMLFISACIGVYFGFFSKTKNTTDEYLMGGKKMKILPIAISLVASQLSAGAIMTVPAEIYSFGVCYMIVISALILVTPFVCSIIIPIYYDNNISNCYEYLELRFNNRARQIVTFTFIFNSFLMLPVWMFVPSLALSQVTGINVHLINTIVCFICVFYTMVGGIKAVVWTDVVQAAIMLIAVFSACVLGIHKVGGLSEVFENANKGGRLHISTSWDPRVRLTLWSAIFNGLFAWLDQFGVDQCSVQRIISLPSIKHAQKTLKLAGVGILIILLTTCFTGVTMFARYYGCDPMLAGLIQKADKMVPFFMQDIMGNLVGMPGVFISCVFSAALSTISANLNSLSGIVYFDYIRPFIKHTDARANYLMKLIVIAMGVYCVTSGLIVENFTSILQMIITVTGINTGAVVAIFLIGMFVPRVNGKAAVYALCVSLAIMLCLIVKAQILLKNGSIVYEDLPTSLDQCEAKNLTFNMLQHTTPTNSVASLDLDLESTAEIPLITTAFGSNRPFSIFEISFYCYKLLGCILFTIFATIFSYIWTPKRDEKINLKLFAPFLRQYLQARSSELEAMPLKTIASEKHV